MSQPAIRPAPARSAVLQALGAHWQHVPRIVQASGRSLESVYGALSRLQRDGVVEKDSAGRWRLVGREVAR